MIFINLYCDLNKNKFKSMQEKIIILLIQYVEQSIIKKIEG